MKVHVQRIADLTVISNLGTGTLTMTIEVGGDRIDVPLSQEQVVELMSRLQQGIELVRQYDPSKLGAKLAPPKAKLRTAELVRRRRGRAAREAPPVKDTP